MQLNDDSAAAAAKLAELDTEYEAASAEAHELMRQAGSLGERRDLAAADAAGAKAEVGVFPLSSYVEGVVGLLLHAPHPPAIRRPPTSSARLRCVRRPRVLLIMHDCCCIHLPYAGH